MKEGEKPENRRRTFYLAVVNLLDDATLEELAQIVELVRAYQRGRTREEREKL